MSENLRGDSFNSHCRDVFVSSRIISNGNIGLSLHPQCSVTRKIRRIYIRTGLCPNPSQLTTLPRLPGPLHLPITTPLPLMPAPHSLAPRFSIRVCHVAVCGRRLHNFSCSSCQPSAVASFLSQPQHSGIRCLFVSIHGHLFQLFSNS